MPYNLGCMEIKDLSTAPLGFVLTYQNGMTFTLIIRGTEENSYVKVDYPGKEPALFDLPTFRTHYNFKKDPLSVFILSEADFLLSVYHEGIKPKDPQ